MIEKNCEARIRSVQVRRGGDKIWITLWEEFSRLSSDLYRCINQWIRNMKVICGRRVIVLKIDFKVDSLGTFCATDYESMNDKLVRALNRGCQSLQNLDHGYADNLGEWVVSLNVDDQYKAIKGFKRCQSFVSANIISQRDIHYQWKRYGKVFEMI
jgi:hypothetical protein